LVVGVIRCIGERDAKILNRLRAIAPGERIFSRLRELFSQLCSAAGEAAEEKCGDCVEDDRGQDQGQDDDAVAQYELAFRAWDPAERSRVCGI
jgi:hypothetical protein